MARVDPPASAIPPAADRAADGSMAMRRHQANVHMQPTREAGGTGLTQQWSKDPAWTDPRPSAGDVEG